MIVVKILVCLALFYTGIICMAVANGMIASLGYDTQRQKDGHVMGSWQTGYIIREYKKREPNGRKHLQAYAIATAGGLSLLTLAGVLVFWVLPGS